MSQFGNGADLLCNFDFRFVGTGSAIPVTVVMNWTASLKK